jgi:hypothetical protein
MPFPDPRFLWYWLPIGYLFSILIETPVLVVGLSPRHPLRDRLVAGVWLTACTYPVVVLVLPLCINPQEQEVLFTSVAEVFAAVTECVLFWVAFGKREEWLRPGMWRDLGVVVLANLASFVAGLVGERFDIFRPLMKWLFGITDAPTDG